MKHKTFTEMAKAELKKNGWFNKKKSPYNGQIGIAAEMVFNVLKKQHHSGMSLLTTVNLIHSITHKLADF